MNTNYFLASLYLFSQDYTNYTFLRNALNDMIVPFDTVQAKRSSCPVLYGPLLDVHF